MNRCVWITALLFSGAVLVHSSADAADPFYERLLREGTDAYNRGDFDNAIQYLRLANFGFLEEPDLLAQGLTLLALSQAKVRDIEGFRESFLRVAEVEERFQAFRRADIPSDIRDEFERAVAELIPRATLEATTSFAHLVVRTEESRVAELSGRAKRRELNRLIEENPRVPHWRLALAEMDLDEGKTDDAVRNASVVLEYDEGNRAALLIRGLAMAEMKRWDVAAADLTASGMARQDVPQAEALLRAYVELEDWRKASTFLASLPDGVRESPSIQGLARSVERNQGAFSAEPPPATADESSTDSDPLSQDEADALQRARTILNQSTDRQSLQDAYRLARSVADRRSDSKRAQHLAGEAAYRLARWEEAVAYFRRGGRPPETQPVTSFYMAVALYESGMTDEAAQVLRSCMQQLQRTPFVENYINKILGVTGRR